MKFLVLSRDLSIVKSFIVEICFLPVVCCLFAITSTEIISAHIVSDEFV